MGRSYSQDLRERVIAEIEDGLSARAAAKKCRVSASTAIRYVKAWRSKGHFQPKKQGAPEGSMLDAHRDWLCRQVESDNDKTIEEIRAALFERGLTVGYGTLWEYLDKLGMTYKKNSSRLRARTR